MYHPQISTNGLISFESGFDSFETTSLPRSDPPFIPLIAPLWGDHDFRDSGTIFYRVISDSSLLEAVVRAITLQNPGYTDFRPTLAVVVTWFQTQFFASEDVVSNSLAQSKFLRSR